MKQKLFTLLTLALFFCSGAWATDVVWDFTDLSATSFTNGKSYSFKATDGTTEMRYSAGSSDAIIAKDGETDGYLKENGKTGSGTVYDIDESTNLGKTRLIRLYVTGKGKLTINCNGTNGVYKVLDGSASGSTLIASLSANTQSSAITVTSSLIWIETTTKGYITTIEWSPVSSDPCTVTFNAGSYGTCGTSSLTEASAGAGVVLPAVTGVTSGYKFTGWFTASSGGTKAGVAGATYYPGSDITLYAQYATLSTECKLISVRFSNTAYGAITEPTADPVANGTVTVPYMKGQSAPTVSTYEISADASYSLSGDAITVTAEDGVTTAVYDITKQEMTPLSVTGDIATTEFTAVPSWIYNHYGWESGKGIKFAKPINDATPRISLGNTRQYYFVGPAKKMTLTSGSGGNRQINIYRNGVKLNSEITSTGAQGETKDIELDESAPCMIMIESAGNTSGDGGFTHYAITANTTVTATVGANGYTTFASTYALDLTDANRPAGLKAYKASRAGSTLTFTALNQTVPAGTGLLLLGETKGGDYDIPVVASGDAVSGNALVGVTTPTAKQSDPDGNYYFVMKKATTDSDPLAFAPLSTSSAVTIPAGKAYVEVPSGDLSAQGLSVSFEDESGDVTGITSVAKPQTTNNASFYDLQGRRVAQPTKGLYIMNGKKVIVK